MGNALFVVWRESVEALLVISILYAWLRARPRDSRPMSYLWGGVAGGIVLASLLAAAMLFVQSELAGNALEYFQAGIQLLAAALITQMVLWMFRHGRHVKRELTRSAEEAFSRAGAWGMAALAAIAVAREGAETAIFLYGLAARGDGGLWAGALLGFALALATAYMLTHGLRVISYAMFFRVTGTLLLLLACALLVAGIEQLTGLEALPSFVDPLWDTSGWLDDSHGLGNVLASFAGYRARPSLTLLVAVVAFWALVAWRLRARTSPEKMTAGANP